MHEFCLYGQVLKDDHEKLLRQLAGICRMQPQSYREVHLIFKAYPPAGINQVQSVGGSQTVTQQDAQKVRSMLNGSLYYMQVVGVVDERQSSDINHAKMMIDTNTAVSEGDNGTSSETSLTEWTLEFRDTPDPGKQPTSSRLLFRIPILDGDVMKFMSNLGYDYVSRYFITGSKFYDQDTTLCLQKLSRPPDETNIRLATDTTIFQKPAQLNDLDLAGNYVLQTSIEVVDGNSPELKDRATRQLLSLKEVLKQSVSLLPGDRLALDTRLPVAARRI